MFYIYVAQYNVGRVFVSDISKLKFGMLSPIPAELYRYTRNVLYIGEAQYKNKICRKSNGYRISAINFTNQLSSIFAYIYIIRFYSN